MNSFIRGAMAGAIATIPMTLTMVWLHRRIPQSERRRLPPEQITVNFAEKAGVEEAVEKRPERKAISLVNHFGYGTSTGAIYGIIEQKIPLDPVTKGVTYGLAVRAGSYLGWLPMMGILSPAMRHPASENAMMITSHIVWGAALGTSVAALANKQSR